MPKYKIGDRAVVSDPHDFLYNKIGTVLEESMCPWVRFNEPTGFYCVVNLPGWKDNYMSCLNEEQLVPAHEKVDTVTEQAVDEALGLVSVSFRIPVELHEALTAIAKDKGYVLPAVVREALSHYVYGA